MFFLVRFVRYISQFLFHSKWFDRNNKTPNQNPAMRLTFNHRKAFCMQSIGLLWASRIMLGYERDHRLVRWDSRWNPTILLPKISVVRDGNVSRFMNKEAYFLTLGRILSTVFQLVEAVKTRIASFFSTIHFNTYLSDVCYLKVNFKCYAPSHPNYKYMYALLKPLKLPSCFGPYTRSSQTKYQNINRSIDLLSGKICMLTDIQTSTL